MAEAAGTTALDLIEAVLARLEAKLPDCAREYFPDKPTEYRLNHPKAALLVQYLRSGYGEPEDCEAVIQERKPQVGVAIIARQLRGRDGAVAILERVIRALLGYQPPGWTRFHIADDRFVRQEAGLWTYLVAISTETLLVEDEEYDDGPLLQRATVEFRTCRGMAPPEVHPVEGMPEWTEPPPEDCCGENPALVAQQLEAIFDTA
jgi:hypothetical protein